MKKILLALIFLTQFTFAQTAPEKPFGVVFSLSKREVQTHDFVEITLKLPAPTKYNPFTEVKIKGEFRHEGGQVMKTEGFCDSKDGTISKIRFMPTLAGNYFFNITYEQGNPNVAMGQVAKQESFAGTFKALSSTRKGSVKVDKNYPYHFIWEGTGEHYFWNGTTTYFLMGWKDEKIINDAIDRLAALKVNRIRVAIDGRVDDGKKWSEPLVKESDKFSFLLNPWVAKNPTDLDNPDFDMTHFNVPHWQKIERMLAKAREKNIVVSIIFYVDGREHGVDPFKKENMGGNLEKLYYAYAAARFSSFSNISWDVANEYHLFRDEAWVEKMGAYLKEKDPYKHIMSVHGNSDFAFRKSTWADMAMYQSWDECGGYEFITQNRKKQEATGRIIPQINEEYGYEDHYPQWGCGATGQKFAPGRSGDNRRQLAWEMYMAGGYQTTGERADEGTGAGNDGGGGWINGRGNDKMTMLKGYGIITDIFGMTEYWKMSPHTELMNYGNLCLAEIGKQYLLYSRLPMCRVALEKGKYGVTMINPRTGEAKALADVDGDAWQYPLVLEGDWAFVLKRK